MKDTKNFIVKTAADLFLQRGYNEVSIADLVKESGLTKGAFYHYFASKELLFKAVLENVTALYEAQCSRGENMTLREFYRADIDSFMKILPPDDDGAKAQYNFFALFFDATEIFPEMRMEIKNIWRRKKDVWREVIMRAQENGEINTCMAAEHIADIFMTSSDGLVLYYIFTRQNGAREALLRLWNDYYASLR